MPQLLDCAKLRGDDYVRQMWQYMNKELFKAIEIEPDHEVLGELFLSLGKCIETLGVSCLTGDELKELTTILDSHFKKHFERSNERAEKRRDEDYDEEAEEEMGEEDDFDAYILNRLSDIIHSLLVTYADGYLSYFDTLVPHFHNLLQPTRSISDRQWALCVFDDVIQFTGAHSHRYSQFFLNRMAESLTDSSAEVKSVLKKFFVSTFFVRTDSSSGGLRFRRDGNERRAGVRSGLCRSIAASVRYDQRAGESLG